MENVRNITAYVCSFFFIILVVSENLFQHELYREKKNQNHLNIALYGQIFENVLL